MALTRLRGEQLDGWLQRSAEVSGESSQRQLSISSLCHLAAPWQCLGHGRRARVRPWTDALRGGCILARWGCGHLGFGGKGVQFWHGLLASWPQALAAAAWPDASELGPASQTAQSIMSLW